MAPSEAESFRFIDINERQNCPIFSAFKWFACNLISNVNYPRWNEKVMCILVHYYAEQNDDIYVESLHNSEQLPIVHEKVKGQ